MDKHVTLSRRQHEVLHHVSNGEPFEEVGAALGLRTGTVNWYMKEIRLVLKARSTAHAVAIAMRLDLLG